METGVMIAFLPVSGEWCKQSYPHLTLVYAGDMIDLQMSSVSAIAKDAIMVARSIRPFALDVVGVEVFGGGENDNPKVDVLRLQPTQQLLLARQIVEHWNASDYPFNPHCTVGPEGSAEGMLPTKLYFEQVAVSWGNRRLNFNLGDYN